MSEPPSRLCLQPFPYLRPLICPESLWAKAGVANPHPKVLWLQRLVLPQPHSSQEGGSFHRCCPLQSRVGLAKPEGSDVPMTGQETWTGHWGWGKGSSPSWGLVSQRTHKHTVRAGTGAPQGKLLLVMLVGESKIPHERPRETQRCNHRLPRVGTVALEGEGQGASRS